MNVKKTGTENTKAWYNFSSVEAAEQYGGGFDELQDITNTKNQSKESKFNESGVN
jgi:hypothetical protein